MEIEALELTTKPIKGIIKRPCLWGRCGSRLFPLIYLRKPKWLDETEFLELCERIGLNLPKGYEIKMETK